MLPSTGYFKGLNCPFYDSGLCERPYCHFRHVKKDLQSSSNDGIESGAILQKLVSAAVQKVLQQTESSSPAALPQVSAAESTDDPNKACSVATVPKATYNPTPISELKKINNSDTVNSEEVNDPKKRHIPVPYTPRKPASLPIKRNFDNDISSKPFVFIPPPLKYTPGSTEGIQLDPYTPKGGTESTEKYLPGVEAELPEYTPDENQTSSKVNYIPSDKNLGKKKIVLEYKPAKVATKKDAPSVTYQPTPRSLAPCFSSDEDEPEIKKQKLANDLNGLDDLGPEFDILDQILDEEKPKEETKHPETNDSSMKKSSKNLKENNNDEICKKEKQDSNKIDNKKSTHDKTKSDKRDEANSRSKDKDEKKSRSSDRKSSHKSSNRDKDKSKSKEKDKEKDKEKSKDEKRDKHKDKKHTSSQSSDRGSKHSDKSSKSSEKHSKSSSSSKSSSDRKSNENKSHKSSKRSKDKKEKSRKDNDSINGVSDTDNHVSDEISFEHNEETYDISESDEETIALECKRIFEEYVPTEKAQNLENLENKIEEEHEEEYVSGKKRVSRTADKNIRVVAKPPIKPDFKLNAAQAMAERLVKIKEYHAAKNNLNSSNTSSSDQLLVKPDAVRNNASASSSKIRIAHVPYASTMMNAKKTIPSSHTAAKPSTSSTVIQTVKKGVQRVAHMPNDKFIDRPGVLEPLASKIPANIRSTYLNMMIDQCLNIYLSTVDAYARAQHEELTTSKKCSTVQIYKNSAVLTISRLKKELQECNGVKKSGSDCNAFQKLPQAISGKTGSAGSWSIESKNKRLIDSKEFNGAKLYSNVQKWILTEEQLESNGFPRLHPDGQKGRAKIYVQNRQKPPVGNIRTCCRCKKEFMIDKKGFAALKEECIYHPNNKYRVRGEARYQCCSQDGMSDGCCVAPSHVHEYLDYDNLKGYVRTLPPEKTSDDYGVYSLDCEMCYTTHGLDLTRVTVINSACKVIYETLVKPLHPIVDYNTRYSGITEEDMAEVKTTLLEVQAAMLAMFSSKTILIGHSLESDFKALKLIHDTVIDTSVLFPHKMGPPYKRALRNLSSEHLKKIIQNSVDGHDSAEDATVCMELIHYKLKEDLKTR